MNEQHREICQKIAALLEMTQGFEVVFLQSALDMQPDLEAYTERCARARQWVTIRFTQPIANLVEELRMRHLTLDAQTVISISGLEQSITDAQQPAKVVAQLNLTRDLLPTQFPCPWLLWLPPHALQNFARFAQDFWSWRAGVFYFDAPEQAITSEIEFLEKITHMFDPQVASKGEFQKQIDNLLRLARHHGKFQKDRQMRGYLSRSEELLPRFEPTPRAGYYNEIGAIYQQQGNQQTAQHYFDLAAQLVESQTMQHSEIPTEKPQRIPPQLQQQIVEFLTSLPSVYDSPSQQAFIYSAGLDVDLQKRLSLGGPPAQFFHLLVSTLIQYGRLDDGRHALVAVLEASKRYVGSDRRAYCDQLIRQVEESA